MNRLNVPEPPEELQGEAQSKWNEMVPHVVALDLATPRNLEGLAKYCEAWATSTECEKILEVEGLLVTGKNGTLRRNPASIALHKAIRVMLKWSKPLGFSPLARILIKEKREKERARQKKRLKLVKPQRGSNK